MKRFLTAILSIIILMPTQMAAQEYVSTPVEISKEKVKVDGKVCYSHIVLEKQTLYSISKAYGVSIDDIYRFNPSVKENGLKKNSIIIIPSADALVSAEQQQAPVSKSDPERVESLSEQKDTVKIAPGQVTHIVKWHEDLNVIAEKYEVSVEDIMKANNLKGRKLKSRQVLVIPTAQTDIAAASSTENQVQAQEIPVEKIVEEIPPQEVAPAIALEENKVTEINATIVLPLSGSDNTPNKNNIDFYCGALLAAYDLGHNGINCKLNAYNVMDKNTPISVETINNSNVVIGPISSADLTRMLNIAPEAKTIVSPLDPRAESLAKNRSNMIQIPTPATVQYKDLINWIEEDCTADDKVLMISEKGARLNNISAPIKTVLDSSAVTYSQFSYSILEGRDVSEPLTNLMTPTAVNRVVIASESEAFVNDVIRNLNLLARNNLKIVLYSTSKIRTFETIEIENLHNLQTHVSLNYYIDYNSPQVRDFLMKYRALYNTEPTQFAFQGYDIAKYFMTMYARYGENWKDNINGHAEVMLQSVFALSRSASHTGMVNNGVRRIMYDNGYVVRTIR